MAHLGYSQTRAFVERDRGTLSASSDAMIRSRYAAAVLALTAAACGGAVNGDGPGGGPDGGATVGGATDGGGPDGPACAAIRASDYDQSCQTDSDCVNVFSGDTCVLCPCMNATINKNAAAEYHPVIPVGAPGCMYLCATPYPPTCVNGVCAMSAPPPPKECHDPSSGSPADCCPYPAPDCATKPDGYPGFLCLDRQNQYCSCSCQNGKWECGC